MFDAKKLLDQFLGSHIPGTEKTVSGTAQEALDLAKKNPLASGALAAVLLGTESGRKLTGSALKIGGLAAIAGLGYQAYKNYQAGKTGEPVATPSGPDLLAPPANSPFDPDSIDNGDEFALSLVRMMIAAARADGHIDDAERSNILGRVSAANLEPDAEAFLAKELAAPLDLDGLIAAATTEEKKIELYTAARLTIDPDTRAERGFLDLLAGRLGLAEELIGQIDATVTSAKG